MRKYAVVLLFVVVAAQAMEVPIYIAWNDQPDQIHEDIKKINRTLSDVKRDIAACDKLLHKAGQLAMQANAINERACARQAATLITRCYEHLAGQHQTHQ